MKFCEISSVIKYLVHGKCHEFELFSTVLTQLSKTLFTCKTNKNISNDVPYTVKQDTASNTNLGANIFQAIKCLLCKAAAHNVPNTFKL